MNNSSEYLPKFTLDQLADRVAMKVDYINMLYKADKVWDSTIEQCLKIEDNPRNVSTVIIDAKKESGIAVGGTNIRWYHVRLTLIYIILYYKHPTDVPYWKPVFNQLIKNIGAYADDKILKKKIQQEIETIKEEDKIFENQKEEHNAKNECSYTEDSAVIELLKKQIEELTIKLNEKQSIPDTITAKQKVRMELACRLMEKAGITKEVLEHHGNKDKAGTIMGTLLDISPAACKVYVSQRDMSTHYHEKTIKQLNPLLKELGTDIQL